MNQCPDCGEQMIGDNFTVVSHCPNTNEYDWYDLAPDSGPLYCGMENEEQWLIWSNEHGAWWAPNRTGYTTILSNAGRYTTAQAQDICFQANRHLAEGFEPFEVMVRPPEHG